MEGLHKQSGNHDCSREDLDYEFGQVIEIEVSSK